MKKIWLVFLIILFTGCKAKKQEIDIKQDNKLMANDIRKYYPEYIPSHEEIVYNTSKIYQ